MTQKFCSKTLTTGKESIGSLTHTYTKSPCTQMFIAVMVIIVSSGNNQKPLDPGEEIKKLGCYQQKPLKGEG